MQSQRYDVSRVKKLERSAYNLYKTPANLKEAQEHFNATSVRKLISETIRPGDYCPCCFGIKKTTRIKFFDSHSKYFFLFILKINII